MAVKSVDPQWLQGLLTKSNYMKSNNLDDVTAVELNNGCEAFINFGSQLKRLTVTFKTSRGSEEKRSIILKAKRLEIGPLDVSVALNAFPCETKMYGDVLRHIETLLKSKGENTAWPKCFGFDETNILFEDLSEHDFKMKPKSTIMDLDHTMLGVRELATIHAMSMIIIKRGLVDPSWFPPSIYARHIPFIIDLNQSSFNGLIRSMKKDWSNEWNQVADKVSDLKHDVGTKMENLWNSTKGKFDVINHGDFWANNMMFKYNADNKSVDMRILDFQCCHYNSPCWDLAYVLYSNLLPEHREKHKATLLQTYLERFQQVYHMFKYEGPIPDMTYIQESLDQISYFCFYLVCTSAPFIIADSRGGFKPDVDNFTATEDDLPSIHHVNYEIELVRDIMKKEVTFWMKHGLLK